MNILHVQAKHYGMPGGKRILILTGDPCHASDPPPRMGAGERRCERKSLLALLSMLFSGTPQQFAFSPLVSAAYRIAEHRGLDLGISRGTLTHMLTKVRAWGLLETNYSLPWIIGYKILSSMM